MPISLPKFLSTEHQTKQVAMAKGVAIVLFLLWGVYEIFFNVDPNRELAKAIFKSSDTVAEALEKVVEKNHCKYEQISFSPPEPSEEYNNKEAPKDGTCHIFHPLGGDISWQVPPEGAADPQGPYGANYSYAASRVNFAKYGGKATYGSVVMELPIATQELCLTINKKLGLPHSAEELPWYFIDFPPYRGVFFTYRYDMGTYNNNAPISPFYAQAGCIQARQDLPYHYMYYRVLIMN